MFVAYAAFGGAWAMLCFKHREELLPIQVSTYARGLCSYSRKCLVLHLGSRWLFNY